MICKVCGSIVNNSESFCPNCGAVMSPQKKKSNLLDDLFNEMHSQIDSNDDNKNTKDVDVFNDYDTDLVDNNTKSTDDTQPIIVVEDTDVNVENDELDVSYNEEVEETNEEDVDNNDEDVVDNTEFKFNEQIEEKTEKEDTFKHLKLNKILKKEHEVLAEEHTEEKQENEFFDNEVDNNVLLNEDKFVPSTDSDTVYKNVDLNKKEKFDKIMNVVLDIIIVALAVLVGILAYRTFAM